MKTNWEYKCHLAQVVGIDNGNCDVIVAKVYGNDAEEIHEHGILIAAAPEMYDALSYLIGAHEHPAAADVRGVLTFVPDALDRAKAIIAKIDAINNPEKGKGGHYSF